MLTLTIYGIVMIVCGIAGAYVASVKNRDASAWAAWGFVFPPSLVVLTLLPVVVRRQR